MISRYRLGSILLLAMLPYGVYVAWSDTPHLVRFFPDDAFYYLKPARHFVRYGWPSFDHLHATNGFQPLQFLIASLVAWPDSKRAQLAMTFLLTALMTLFALFLLVRGTSAKQRQPDARLFLLLSLPPGIALFITNVGMESSMVLCATVCLWLIAASAAARGFDDRNKNLLLGIALAAFLLARLDNVISSAGLILYILAGLLRAASKSEIRKAIIRAGTILLPPLICCGAYLLLNLATTDHVLPISAYIKQHEHAPFADSWQSATRGSTVGSILALTPLLFSFAMICDGLLRSRSKRQRWGTRLSPLLALNFGNLLFYLYLWGWASNFQRWYFAFPYSMTLINMVFWLEEAKDGWRRRREGFYVNIQTPRQAGRGFVNVLLLLNLSTCFSFLLWFGGRSQSTSYHLWRMAQQLNSQVPASAIIGTYDAGVVGFFSQAKVINLDGLCNNFNYFLQYKKPRRFLEYIRQNRISHLLLRDSLLSDTKKPRKGSEISVIFLPDARIGFQSNSECFRYDIPGKFSERCYQITQD